MIRGQEKKTAVSQRNSVVIIFLSRLALNIFLVKLKTLAGFLNVMAQFLLKQLEVQDGRIHLFATANKVQDVQDNTSETRGILENYH